jgi:hypothetical protein
MSFQKSDLPFPVAIGGYSDFKVLSPPPKLLVIVGQKWRLEQGFLE